MKKIVSLIFLHWLKILATLQLSKVKPKIVGVTGSAGKSSAVRSIATVLKKKYKVKWTKKGNSETGIPLEILNIEVDNFSLFGWIRISFLGLFHLLFDWEKYDIFVVEMGIDSEIAPKNMDYLLSFVHPLVGVLLNVSSVHAANFSGRNPLVSIANQKGRLLSAIPIEGLAIMDWEIESLYHLSRNITSPINFFSSKKNTADIYLQKYEISLSGTRYIFSINSQKFQIFFDRQLHIEEFFGGIASAILVGQFFSIPIQDSISILEEKFKLPKGRMSIIEGINDSLIIDSSYNSSPVATRGALSVLKKMPGRKIAILGDMRELGNQTIIEHQKMAKIAEASADVIIFIGPLSEKYSYPALSESVKQATKCFPTAYLAIDYLRSIVHNSDVILVKGSQNTIFLEIVVQALMRHPEQAVRKLCRQTPYWQDQRQKLIDKYNLEKK